MVGSDVADASRSLDIQSWPLLSGLRSDVSFFQQLKPKNSFRLKLFLASKFTILRFSLSVNAGPCEYLSQTLLPWGLKFSFETETPWIGGNLLLVNLGGMLGCGSFEITVLFRSRVRIRPGTEGVRRFVCRIC